jgi:CRISPR-associated endoribonuclease Cas6
MRLKLTLQKSGNGHQLPLNYAYPLSSWIYRILSRADESYADFLHNQGYVAAGKRFKFFTFSALDIPRFKIEKGSDRIQVLSPEIGLTVSFYTDKGAETFVMGLFAEQQLQLGDRQSQMDFTVRQVESLDWQIATDTLRLRTLSPLVVSRKNERGHDDYLSPEQEGYGELLFKNLVDKYVAAALAMGKPLPDANSDSPLHFRLLSDTVKERRITLKADTPHPIKVRGYLFDFELTAPKELLEMGLLAGLGKYNAEGFGCCEVKE